MLKPVGFNCIWKSALSIKLSAKIRWQKREISVESWMDLFIVLADDFGDKHVYQTVSDQFLQTTSHCLSNFVNIKQDFTCDRHWKNILRRFRFIIIDSNNLNVHKAGSEFHNTIYVCVYILVQVKSGFIVSSIMNKQIA